MRKYESLSRYSSVKFIRSNHQHASVKWQMYDSGPDHGSAAGTIMLTFIYENGELSDVSIGSFRVSNFNISFADMIFTD